jgi:O-antigen ligase
VLILIAVVVALAGTAAMLLAIAHPRLFVYAMFALAPTQFLFIPVADFFVSPADGLVLVAAAGMMVRLSAGHRRAWASLAAHRYLAAFLLVSIASLVISGTWARTIVRFPLAIVPSLLAVEALRTRRDIRRATIAVILGGVLDVAYGVWLHVSGGPTHPTRFSGMSGGWSGSNFVAMTVMTATMILLALRGRARRPSGLFAPGLLAGFGLATLSKMVPLTFLASWLGGVRSLVSRANKRRLAAVAVGLAMLVLLAPSVRNAVWARFERQERVDASELNSIDIRLMIFQVATSAFLENPITGIGFARFMEYSSAKFETTVSTPYEAATHNTYLAVLVETGLVGLFVFLLHFLQYVRRLPLVVRRVFGEHDVVLGAAFAGLPIVLASAATVDLIFSYTFWSVCGLALAALRKAAREARGSERLPSSRIA